MKTCDDGSGGRLLGRAKSLINWLIPGLGVKRYLLLVLFGTALIGVGLAVLLLDIYRTAPNTWWLPLVSAASLRFLPRLVRVVVFAGLGIGLIMFGIWELNRSLMLPFIRPGHRVVDALRNYRQRERGPRVVAIGGGHGQAVLLRGMKTMTRNLTAIVTVADDGGSSGRLRQELGILPPGDIRNCLAALSNDEALLGQLFQYRFANGSGGLDGHSFGNLFISALTEITGSFDKAVIESGKVLGIDGRVLPSTVQDVRLAADVVLPFITSEVRVQGESQIPNSPGRIRRVWLEPDTPSAFPPAVQAVLSADLLVVGPGSLYTSILPNLLVKDLLEAIRSSRALKIYVCNITTQPGETDGYTCLDHLRAIEEHIGSSFFDIILCNEPKDSEPPPGVQWVQLDDQSRSEYPIHCVDLQDDLNPLHHDSQKLAHEIMEIYEERTGPLVQ